MQFQGYESLSEGEGVDPSLTGIPDDTPLLVGLESFPLPPEVTSRRPSPIPVTLSAEAQEMDDLRAEQAGEELLLMWDKRDWRLSASSSELPCLPPSSATSPKYPSVIDLGDESDEGHPAEDEVEERPSSPDVGQLVDNATPRLQRRRSRQLDVSESSADELGESSPHQRLLQIYTRPSLNQPLNTASSAPTLHSSPLHTPRQLHGGGPSSLHATRVLLFGRVKRLRAVWDGVAARTSRRWKTVRLYVLL